LRAEETHRIQEPRADLRLLKQENLPLEMPLPFRSRTAAILDGAEGQEIGISFREEVPRIPSTTYGSFGLYRYPAKFIPQVVAYVLESWGEPGQKVLDPYAGSGTTGLVARLYGLDYELWDLNPMLQVLHRVAIMQPKWVATKNFPSQLVESALKSTQEWLPQWSNLRYWYPEVVLPLLARVWGFYHSVQDEEIRNLFVVPLLKVTRTFSYNDPQRQKLSRSPKAMQRVDALLNGDWEQKFARMLHDEISTVLKKLAEYHALKWVSREVEANIFCGSDSLEMARQRCQEPSAAWDILITSPPYLQAQEYIRSVKMDLFWLGYTEEQIRFLSKQELPYKKVEAIPILSPTYEAYRERIQESHLRQMYEQYFHSVLGTLTHLSPRVHQRICLFVGPATIRGMAIPIDRIFAEHFAASGWRHEGTLVDKIVARVMFRSKFNPATGIEDHRMPTEHLVVLHRKD